MKKKPSYNDLLRKVKRTVIVADAIIDDMAHKLNLERLTREMVAAVLEDVASGQMTKHEAFQWLLKWNDDKAREMKADELADYLQIPNIKEVFEDIEKQTFREALEFKTQMYLQLDAEGV